MSEPKAKEIWWPRKGKAIPLVLIDVPSAHARRYVRLPKPRHAGDRNQVEMTHDAEVDFDSLSADVIARFRSNPEAFE